MVEYGHGVGEGTSGVSGFGGGGGASGGGGGGGDWGAGLGRMAGDAVDTVAALPTEQLLLLVVAVFVGLFLLKRAL